jgi:hypothetical protein
MREQMTWRRRVNRKVAAVSALAAVVIIFTAGMCLDRGPILTLVLGFAVLVLEAGVWYAASPVLTCERRYSKLRSQFDHFLGLVRTLNRAVVARAPTEQVEQTRGAMHASVDVMFEVAGLENRKGKAPVASAGAAAPAADSATTETESGAEAASVATPHKAATSDTGGTSEPKTWRRGVNRRVAPVSAFLGVGIILVAGMYLERGPMLIGALALGVLVLQAGVWYMANPVLTSERRYAKLRERFDRFQELVRKLNRSVVAGAPPEQVERIRESMHATVDEMHQVAGMDAREAPGPAVSTEAVAVTPQVDEPIAETAAPGADSEATEEGSGGKAAAVASATEASPSDTRPA